MGAPLWPLTYEQTTIVAQATERRALDADEFADRLLKELDGSAEPAARELRVSTVQRAEIYRKRAAELRMCADRLWAFRRQLPDAPLYMPATEG